MDRELVTHHTLIGIPWRPQARMKYRLVQRHSTHIGCCWVQYHEGENKAGYRWIELLSRESHGTVIVTRSRKQVFAGTEQIIVYRPYFTQYLLRTIMSTEKARFAQEVAEVEQWWKVRSPAVMLSQSIFNVPRVCALLKPSALIPLLMLSPSVAPWK